jgi:hypothetical protein
MNVIIGALNFTSRNLVLLTSLPNGITMLRNSVQRGMHALLPDGNKTCCRAQHPGTLRSIAR